MLFGDKTVLLTGAARGFGRTLALEFAREGADVAICDLGSKRTSSAGYPLASVDDLESTSAEIRRLGRQVLPIEADVSQATDCARMAEATIEAFGKIDVLVANAGVATMGPSWELTEREWDLVHDVCLKGAWLTTKYVIPVMIRQRSGKVVFTASRNGLRVERGFAHYNAAKAGLIQFAKTLALELGEYEINVNAVCPTQMANKSQAPVQHTASQSYWDEVVGHEGATWEEFDAASGSENLFTRGGQPDFRDVAEGVLWLASDRARLVTGIALPLDAGYIVKRGG